MRLPACACKQGIVCHASPHANPRENTMKRTKGFRPGNQWWRMTISNAPHPLSVSCCSLLGGVAHGQNARAARKQDKVYSDSVWIVLVVSIYKRDRESAPTDVRAYSRALIPSPCRCSSYAIHGTVQGGKDYIAMRWFFYIMAGVSSQHRISPLHTDRCSPRDAEEFDARC